MPLIYIAGNNVAEQAPKKNQERLRSQGECGYMPESAFRRRHFHQPVEFSPELERLVAPIFLVSLVERAIVHAELNRPVSDRIAIRKKCSDRLGVIQGRAVIANVRTVEQNVTALFRRDCGNNRYASFVRGLHLL
jgi:hypothetical protein